METKTTKRALMIVDVEPCFLNDETERILPLIENEVRKGGYDIFVIGEYTKNANMRDSKEKRSWKYHHDKPSPYEKTVANIRRKLPVSKLHSVVKSTRSLFGNTSELAKYLAQKKITDITIVGVETHECVLATAFDAMDSDFKTTVLESCVASKDVMNHEAGIRILRAMRLTDTR